MFNYNFPSPEEDSTIIVERPGDGSLATLEYNTIHNVWIEGSPSDPDWFLLREDHLFKSGEVRWMYEKDLHRCIDAFMKRQIKEEI